MTDSDEYDGGGDPVCAGVRIPAALGERGGDVDGEDAERVRHVFGEQRFPRASRHRHSLGICGVSVLRVHLPPLRLPGRLFHNQRFAFSSLNDAVARAHHTHTERDAEEYLCGAATCFYCTPYAV